MMYYNITPTKSDTILKVFKIGFKAILTISPPILSYFDPFLKIVFIILNLFKLYCNPVLLKIVRIRPTLKLFLK